MTQAELKKKTQALFAQQEKLLNRRNSKAANGNGIYDRYAYPVLTAAHAPLIWRYDFDQKSNPYLQERMGINATFNAGAIEFNGRIAVVVRVEGADRKSFLAVADSPNGIDNFRFWDYPILLPQTENLDVNVYDVRIVKHEDGWIYGLFCTERKDPKAPAWDTSSAVAQCGIVRTKDLKNWERLSDLKTKSPQQRNVVLHPEFANGQYALYTRPQDDFIQAGKGGGIGWGLTRSMENAVVDEEIIMDNREYHTIKEVKNGQGPAPEVITHRPAGYFIGPQGDERVGDVSNVVFSNGWVARKDGTVFIYYASSDTRLHVATSTVDKLLDYVMHTPEDPLLSHKCVEQRYALIRKNLEILGPRTKPARKKK
jgi:4-O-beta-D-mannosyl-D-glucose phosphorylase